jgi:hypothetical protein
MPKIKDGESKKDFLSRCMGDTVMIEDYPDNKQRYAICNDLWDKKDSNNLASKKPIIETRSYPFEVSEIRTLEDNTTKITGYAAVYNQLSDDLGGFREKIKKGFFTPVLGDDVRALINHDSNLVMGRTTSGTLIIQEDRNGLNVEIFPANTSYENDLITHMKRGDVNQMSFQWITEKDEWDSSDLNNIVRTLILAKELWDVSVVTFPAYPQTNAETNSARQILIKHLEEMERDLEEISSKEEEKDRKKQEHISVMRKKLIVMEKEI